MKKKFATFSISKNMQASMSKEALSKFIHDYARKLGMYKVEQIIQHPEGNTDVFAGPVMTYPHIMGMLRRRTFTHGSIKNVMIRAL